AQTVLAHGADAYETERARGARTKPFERDHRSSGAANGVCPMLVDDGNRLGGSRIRENNITGTIETAHGVDHAIVVVGVQAATRDRFLLQDHGLDVPVIVERLTHIQLLAWRHRP